MESALVPKTEGSLTKNAESHYDSRYDMSVHAMDDCRHKIGAVRYLGERKLADVLNG